MKDRLIQPAAMRANITWRPLLGGVEPGAVKLSPVYRISYQPNGFDRVRKNPAKKTAKWMRANGAGHLAETFLAYSKAVVDMGAWIDHGFLQAKDVYEARGYQHDVDPRRIFLIVEPIPIVDGRGAYAGGTMSEDGRGRIVICAMSGFFDNPATADLRTFKQYLPWEIGHVFGFLNGHRPRTVDDEWGDNPPRRS